MMFHFHPPLTNVLQSFDMDLHSNMSDCVCNVPPVNLNLTVNVITDDILQDSEPDLSVHFDSNVSLYSPNFFVLV